MRMEKQAHKLSQPHNRPPQADPAKAIANNHEYLNFVKKNAKMM
jgi:hypothetical protein